jgi:hypothetical protein
MPEADTPGGARTGGMATPRLVLASPLTRRSALLIGVGRQCDLGLSGCGPLPLPLP